MNCEFCGKLGARKVMLPERADPRYPTGWSTNYLCWRCEDRANAQLLKERIQRQQEAQKKD